MDNYLIFGTEDLDEIQEMWEDMSWERQQEAVERAWMEMNDDYFELEEEYIREDK